MDRDFDKPKQGGNPPSASTAAPRVTLPASFSFGELVAGSRKRRTLSPLFNLTAQPGVARVMTSGQGFRLESANFTHLFAAPMTPEQTGETLRDAPTVAFSPEVPGSYQGELAVQVEWGSSSESMRVSLSGSARGLEDAPAAEPEPVVSPDATHQRDQHQRREAELIAAEARRTDPVAENARQAFDRAREAATWSAHHLAMAQKLGTDLLEGQARSFSRTQIPKAGHWWDLIQLGLTMATGGIAGHLVGTLLPRLMSSMGGLKDGAELSRFTSEAVKDGLKSASRTALGNHPGVAAAPSRRQGVATSPATDFFFAQGEVLLEQAAENQKVIAARAEALFPLLRTEPEAATAAMQAMSTELDRARKFAADHQADVTAPLWLTAVARGAQATDPGSVDGTLAIHVRPTSTIEVLSARANGVARDIGDRLLDLPLLTTRMPLRVVLEDSLDHPSMITRDETMKIGVRGDFDRVSRKGHDRQTASSEAAAITGASEFLSMLLTRPLRAWGIDEVLTDDVNGKVGTT
jgi:hypothetical protein